MTTREAIIAPWYIKWLPTLVLQLAIYLMAGAYLLAGRIF